ncbi:unnamed protein product [Acanthoscelides obtectus]|uniref:Uncharacterized protein n=1 Tax=Acanthoscelides obtectus TaxID=200917 RepID=A0A9P0NY65_ACAOB|nr:unnamed protein product [Acanthoscelides obtectus]CAK1679235.1 hypothetical protein AOBTE_LOCUS32181 [Acanthoscelides obtectus]
MITDDRIIATEVHKTRHGNKYKKKSVQMYPSVKTAGRIYEEAIQSIGQNYKQNQDKELNDYYLAPHLFLDPFLKSRKSKGNIAEESALSADEEAN